VVPSHIVDTLLEAAPLSQNLDPINVAIEGSVALDDVELPSHMRSAVPVFKCSFVPGRFHMEDKVYDGEDSEDHRANLDVMHNNSVQHAKQLNAIISGYSWWRASFALHDTRESTKEPVASMQMAPFLLVVNREQYFDFGMNDPESATEHKRQAEFGFLRKTYPGEELGVPPDQASEIVTEVIPHHHGHHHHLQDLKGSLSRTLSRRHNGEKVKESVAPARGLFVNPMLNVGEETEPEAQVEGKGEEDVGSMLAKQDSRAQSAWEAAHEVRVDDTTWTVSTGRALLQSVAQLNKGRHQGNQDGKPPAQEAEKTSAANAMALGPTFAHLVRRRPKAFRQFEVLARAQLRIAADDSSSSDYKSVNKCGTLKPGEIVTALMVLELPDGTIRIQCQPKHGASTTVGPKAPGWTSLVSDTGQVLLREVFPDTKPRQFWVIKRAQLRIAATSADGGEDYKSLEKCGSLHPGETIAALQVIQLESGVIRVQCKPKAGRDLRPGWTSVVSDEGNVLLREILGDGTYVKDGQVQPDVLSTRVETDKLDGSSAAAAAPPPQTKQVTRPPQPSALENGGGSAAAAAAAAPAAAAAGSTPAKKPRRSLRRKTSKLFVRSSDELESSADLSASSSSSEPEPLQPSPSSSVQTQSPKGGRRRRERPWRSSSQQRASRPMSANLIGEDAEEEEEDAEDAEEEEEEEEEAVPATVSRVHGPGAVLPADRLDPPTARLPLTLHQRAQSPLLAYVESMLVGRRVIVKHPRAEEHFFAAVKASRVTADGQPQVHMECECRVDRWPSCGCL
jgi:hypothetical protein